MKAQSESSANVSSSIPNCRPEGWLVRTPLSRENSYKNSWKIACIALAVAVALWGYGYKLSRYCPHPDSCSRASVAQLCDKHQGLTGVAAAVTILARAAIQPDLYAAVPAESCAQNIRRAELSSAVRMLRLPKDPFFSTPES